jgi:hypothetical protein
MTATPFIAVPWTSPSAVRSVLVEGPTEEPLTLDEAKQRAGLDWLAGDPRDAMLQDWIRAARAQVEHDTGLALLTQTRDIYFGAAIGPIVPLPSQAQPVQSIAPIDPARAGAVLPCSPWTAGAVQSAYVSGAAAVRVIAGWPTPAALRAEAPTLLHAVGLLVAHYATNGRDLMGDTVGQRALTPLGYADAIAPYQLIWVI